MLNERAKTRETKEAKEEKSKEGSGINITGQLTVLSVPVRIDITGKLRSR